MLQHREHKASFFSEKNKRTASNKSPQSRFFLIRTMSAYLKQHRRTGAVYCLVPNGLSKCSSLPRNMEVIVIDDFHVLLLRQFLHLRIGY